MRGRIFKEISADGPSQLGMILSLPIFNVGENPLPLPWAAAGTPRASGHVIPSDLPLHGLGKSSPARDAEDLEPECRLNICSCGGPAILPVGTIPGNANILDGSHQWHCHEPPCHRQVATAMP